MLCLRWCNPFLGQAGWLICFWHTFYYLLHHENMIRKIIYGVYAILGMMTMAACSGQSDASEISLEKMHGFPTENTGFLKGVSALYAGVIEGNLLIAGGCNFPDIPVADGGKKAYYRDIYIAPLSNDTAFEWKKIGQLSQAAAYGVTISTEKGLICVGGTTATHSLSDVFLLSLQKDTLKRETLPSLPVTMDNMAGALVGHSLYIVGGNVNGIPSSAMYMLDLSDLSGGWKRETDIPGEPRVQPVCVAQDGKLYVWGGFAPAVEGHQASLSVDGYMYSPETKEWSSVATPYDAEGNEISLGGGMGTSSEGYVLTVTPDQVLIRATSGAGLFYGVQTMLQMVDEKGLPAGVITDEPRFAYRGFMMDVSRHFFDKEFIKKQMDALAYYKLNRLHLHLTDAAGWRLEIKKYPRLTEFAAWREFPTWKEWWNNGRRYEEEGSKDAHGGYYTQDDIRELVAYAQERFITVIPEIEMPAHSEEVLTAYPELSCTHEPYKQADFCVGNEKTFEFLENVLTEVMELFPSEYIHIGGDEAGKASWPTCKLCQARMKKEGLKDVNELQSYLIHRIEVFLNAHGRKLLGWDEILEGGLAPNATVMSWRGTEGGMKAVDSGHMAIMSPGEFCYFDSYQDAPDSQPEAIGGYLPLSKVYSFNPVPDTLSADKVQLVYGVQANLFTEYIPTPEHAEMMIYPRILALAEVAWSAPSVKNYDDFHVRALKEVEALKAEGYHPFDLKNEIGNRPGADQPVQHLAVGKKVAYGPDAAYYPGYSAGGDSALVDGVIGGWTYGDRRWQGFIDKKRMDVTIDMEKETEIHSVGADFMQVCGPEVFMPSEVIISVSNDGKEFTELKRMEHKVVKDDKVTFINFGWEGNAKARYIRYQASSGEFGGFLFTDEIVVK